MIANAQMCCSGNDKVDLSQKTFLISLRSNIFTGFSHDVISGYFG